MIHKFAEMPRQPPPPGGQSKKKKAALARIEKGTQAKGRHKKLNKHGQPAGEGEEAVGYAGLSKEVKRSYDTAQTRKSRRKACESPPPKSPPLPYGVRLANRTARIKKNKKPGGGGDVAQEEPDLTDSEDEGSDEEENEDGEGQDDHDEEDVEQDEGDNEAQDDEAPVTLEELLPGASEGGQTTQEKDVDELYEDFSSLFKAYQMKPGEKRNEELNKIVGAIYSKTQAGGEKFNLGVYTHPDFDKHRDKEYEWPERASRIKSIMEALAEGGILNQAMELSEERLASKEDILLVHSPDRWAEGEQLEGMTDEERSKWNDKMYEEKKSLYAGEDTFFCARLAAGGLLVAVDTIFNNGVSGLIFAVIRPPGHHACIKHGGGFCHLNNISIGAAYAVSSLVLKL